MNPIYFILLSLLLACKATPKSDIDTAEVVPTSVQQSYQSMETIGFIHFTVNTFTNKEWGYGDEDPSVFNPTQLNTEQWVLAAKAAGMKELLLTAKHHDGFCLWPSLYTEHSIKNSPYKNGKGDIVREFVDACRKHDLKAGLYLSPWDRNHSAFGKPEYLQYYRNQLTELLTRYGPINEIWFDGANGGDGYYGGANEIRKIDKKSYYQWDSTFALVKRLQSDISIFSDAGPDIRWVGNENGSAGETFWSAIDADKLIIGDSDQKYLNTGEAEGSHWIIGQCDVSIRPGWFYHETEDNAVKSPQQLVDLYYQSVGRNAVLLLNLPPDKRGLLHENDLASLKIFRQILDETFAHNLATTANASSASDRKSKYHQAKNTLDNDPKTYWAAHEGFLPYDLVLRWEKEQLFDRILLQEPIHLGQRISRFQIEALFKGEWIKVTEGSTIGYKRLLRFEPVVASAIRITILESLAQPAISNVEVYKASSLEPCF